MLNPDPKQRLKAFQVLNHPWVKEDSEAPDTPLDNVVLNRLKQFSAMNKLKKAALRVLRNAVNKTFNRITDLRKEIVSLNKGVLLAAEASIKAQKDLEAVEPNIEVVDGQPLQTENSGRLKRLRGYDAKAKDEEISLQESLEAKSALLSRALEENKVQKAADLIQPAASGGKIDFSNGKSSRDRKDETNKNNGGINQSIRRVRKLSEMTEKMSQSLLNGVLLVSGSVTAPLVQSKAGKAFFSMLPGEVLLASLDAVGKVLDAVELTERKAFAATSGAVTGVVSKKFGESAGEATEDAFATAGHAIGMAWNVFKIRNALNPKSSVKSSIVRNAVMNKKTQANISRTGRHDC